MKKIVQNEEDLIPKKEGLIKIKLRFDNVIKDFRSMFYNCENLIYADISHLNTANLTNMSDMFYFCENLKEINFSSLNTENVIDMSYMFCGCYSLEKIDLSDFKTKNVKNMCCMFMHCRNLKDEHARHGTRTPPFNEDSNYIDQFGTKWEGNGELTAIGKRMHYILGIQNRIKYSSLIDFSRFNPKEIQIFSTNSVRTLKSLEAELHGMYLPGTGDTLSYNELPLAFPPGKEFLPKEVLEEVENMDNSTIIIF